MFNEWQITGTIVNAFVVCPKKAWLQARGIGPTKTNEHILMGKAYHLNMQNKKIGNIEVDFISSKGHYEVVEYKKTLSNKEASKMQLLYYMYTLQKGLPIKKIVGKIVSIETDEKVFVSYGSAEETIINDLIQKIMATINSVEAPKETMSSLCLYCGHNLYCI